MLHYDPFAIMSYETFLLSQYHINCQGLFYNQGHYLIHCPELLQDTKALDGEDIYDWFSDHKQMSASISITSTLPPTALKIDSKIANNIPIDSGYLITNADVEYEIDLLIPKIFPDYKYINGRPIKIVFHEEISEEGIRELHQIFISARFPLQVSFENDNTVTQNAPKKLPNFFQNVQTYRQLKSKLSAPLANVWEEDEDNWLQVRNKVITQNPSKKDQYRPASFSGKQLRCLVDCTHGTPDNIRNYLTIYEQVCLVAPTRKTQEEALLNLGISTNELKELFKLNKVQLLFPKSIERYDQNLLEELLEIDRARLHFSRSITTMTIMEMRSRNPFLFPSIPVEDKQVLLHAVDHSIANSLQDKKVLPFIRNLLSDTGNSWVRFPNWLNQLDSEMLSNYGTANLIRAMLEFQTEKDFHAAFSVSVPAVEWAAATGSILIPSTINGYDTASICGLVADVYSGTPNAEWVLQDKDFANFTAENILAIGQYLPVLDLATSFNSIEISRFRKLILDIAHHQPTTEDLLETIEAYNHFVKQYESNKDNWSSWNIKGFVIGLIGKAASGIPMASWLMGHALKHVIKYTSKDPRLGRAIETIEASLQGGVPEAVLLSKMRDKVKKKL